MNAAFSTALSGLNADSSAINVIGSDLANLNTTGYKSSEVEFSALMSQSLGAAGSSGQVGLGVSTPIVVPQYTQGSIQSTGGPTDAAIQGNGFFVVQGQNNQTLYTRDGAFQINSAGQLVTATGQNVQGWSAVNGTINPNGAVGNLSVPLGATIPATATTTMNMALNLNSQVATTAAGATVTAPINVIDSQGSSHTLTVTFNKTATNSWKYTVTIPAADLTAGGTTTIATGTMTFDANGNLTSPTAANDPQVLKITGLADGASNLSINWNLYQNGSPTITQFAEASGVSGTT
ncbi:MAG: flagellar hook-basal body complex protein, partial [Bryobacteraceae bacterium]